jgi:hypothetical protein
MPVDVSRRPIDLPLLSVRRAEPGAEPMAEGDFWSNLADTYATGWMGATYNEMRRIYTAVDTPTTPGFDGLDYVPEGYEQYADAYALAGSAIEVDGITSRINETNAARERLGNLSFGSQLGYGFLAGVFDPTNLIGGPLVKGAGFARGALMGGASIGTVNAMTEGVRHGLDPTSTIEETALNIGLGYGLAGLIGGAIGKFSRAPGGGVRVQGPSNMAPEQRSRVEGVSRDLERALAAGDGYINNELIDFNNQGVRVVLGSTGKVDADGNPVPAFFRPKEAFEEAARRQQVSRAADDALGDVVPEDPTTVRQRLDDLEARTEGMVDEAEAIDPFSDADAAMPFGTRAGDEAAPEGTTRAKPDEPEDTIFVDVDALRARYADKPWTTPRVAGVDPLPENAFKSEEEWVNFVVLHELNHKTTKRLPDETMPAYENRINQMALDEVRAGRLPLSPTDGLLEKITLLPSTQGTLMRKVGRDSKIHGFFQLLGGDHATLMIANRAGLATTPGGSVHGRAQIKWFPEYFRSNIAIRRGYSKYVRGFASDSNFKLGLDNFTAAIPIVGTARRQAKMTYSQFNDHVGMATFTDEAFTLHGQALTEGEMGIVREAATELRKVFQRIEADGRELGMFNQQKRAQQEIGWRQEKINEIKARMASEEPPTEGQRELWQSLINKWDKELNELDEIIGLEPEGSMRQQGAEAAAARKQTAIDRMQDKLDADPDADLFRRYVANGARETNVKAMVGDELKGQSAYVIDEAGKIWRLASTDNPSGDHAELGQAIGEAMFDRLVRVRSFGQEIAWDFAGAVTGAQERALKRIAAQAKRSQVEVMGDMPTSKRQPPNAMPKSEGQLDSLQSRINEMDFKLAEAMDRLGRLTDNPLRAGGDDHYWHRVYHVGKIRDRYDDFVNLIGMGFAREAGDETAITPEILARARKVADKIIGEGMEENTYGIGGLRALGSRAIPLSNKELSDFIVLDADAVMQSYVRRMGPAIEMQRAFGSRDLDQQITDMRVHMAGRGFSADEIQDMVWEAEAMRDRVLNTFHAKDPLSWDNRTARAIKMFTNLATMGRGILSQTVDVARTLAAEGYEPLFKAIAVSFDKGFAGVIRGSMAREAGEGFEFALMRSAARAMEDDSAIIATRQTGVERRLANLQAGFFTVNLMTPFTTIWKDFSSIMTAHRLIRDANMVADAVRSGRTRGSFTKAEAKVATELASWGIDLRGAQLIADMPYEKTKEGLFLPNIGAWQDTAGERAAEVFRGALSGNIRSNVITPGPLQRAAIMDGVFQWKGKRVEQPLLSLPFQLLSFSMSSSAKITHAMLSGRDRNRYVTLTSLLIGGYVAAWLKAGDSWEYMTPAEKGMAAFDSSGIAGWMGDGIERVEAVTGYGPREAMGQKQFGEGEANTVIGAIGGPGPGVMAGVAEAFLSEDMEDTRRADLIRRGVIGSNMVWWNDRLKEWSRAAASNSSDFTFEQEEDWSMAPEVFDPEAIEP